MQVIWRDEKNHPRFLALITNGRLLLIGNSLALEVPFKKGKPSEHLERLKQVGRSIGRLEKRYPMSMHKETTEIGELSRRDFFKGGVLAAAAVGGASLLGATPSSAYAVVPNNASDVAHTSNFPLSIDDDPYFSAPDPITDIAETIDVDVLVVGAGAAGVPCACIAAQHGAKVAVLQKSPRVYSHGIIFAGFNAPAIVEELGTSYSDDEIKALKLEFLTLNGFGTDTALLNKFFEECSEAIDWQIKTGTELGLPHMFFGGGGSTVAWPMQATDLNMAFAKHFSETYDLTFYYNTPALRLVTDDSGAVTGAIGQRDDGSFIQINAARGVVIATGGFGGNKELIARWLPAASSFTNGCFPEDNTGDGALMAIWAGADIAPLRSKKIDIRFYGDSPMRTDIEKEPFLLVNDKGRRIMKEDASEMESNGGLCKEPSESGVYYNIFDANYGEWLKATGSERAILSDEQIADYESKTKPALFEADTIAGLAEAIGVEAKELQATIDRNNELAAAGYDADYYKDASNLYTIDTAPYYAMVREYTIGGTLGALKVNDKCQVINRATGDPISGLYCIGNDMGGLQTGQDYVWHDHGMTLGSATTFGYMVGRDLAKA
jgi:succinate dehydrogenase/fumarate reductase flavoprotein subunit